MRKPLTFRLIVTLALALICVVSTSFRASADDTKPDSIVIDGTYHTPAQIVALLDRSILAYEIRSLADTAGRDSVDELVSPDRYVDWLDGIPTVHNFSPSDSLRGLFAAADSAYKEKNCEAAIAGYRRVLELDTSYSRMLVFIGDGFFCGKQYDSAAAYFRLAIEKNFVDYQAHWFLSDALAQLGEFKAAEREITLAHILNFHQPNIFSRMKDLRHGLGTDWKDWSYEPRYSLLRNPADSHIVEIKCDTAWIGYAMTKALWEFEPGYAEKMLGRVPSPTEFNVAAEKEAFLCHMVTHDDNRTLDAILKDGEVNEFLYYELLARQHPAAVVALPRAEIERIADYLELYH